MSIIHSKEQLQRDVPAAEASLNDALFAVSTLMANMAHARRVSGLPAGTGHASLARLAKAQVSLVQLSGDVLRVHGDLVQIGREVAGLDLHEQCPASASAGIKPNISLVA